MLTDHGVTKDVFYGVAEEEWQALCEEYGFAFIRGQIERPFDCMKDLYDFIDFLHTIADRDSPVEVDMQEIKEFL